MNAPVDGKYYEVAPPNSLGERILVRARDRIYDDFIRVCAPHPFESILDVGVSDVVGAGANVIERRYPFRDRITAAGLGEAPAFRSAFPAITYQRIDPDRPLPFSDGQFHVATSFAVIEHVGSVEKQRRFVAELLRVGKRVFLTVPHRFFPIEHHTAIPLLHWTDFTFSAACKILGKAEWSRPTNLILMTQGRLLAACPPGVPVTIGRTGVLLGPCSSNLFLYVPPRG
jgi:hypothetical protein